MQLGLLSQTLIGHITEHLWALNHPSAASLGSGLTRFSAVLSLIGLVLYEIIQYLLIERQILMPLLTR